MQSHHFTMHCMVRCCATPKPKPKPNRCSYHLVYDGILSFICIAFIHSHSHSLFSIGILPYIPNGDCHHPSSLYQWQWLASSSAALRCHVIVVPYHPTDQPTHWWRWCNGCFWVFGHGVTITITPFPRSFVDVMERLIIKRMWCDVWYVVLILISSMRPSVVMRLTWHHGSVRFALHHTWLTRLLLSLTSPPFH